MLVLDLTRHPVSKIADIFYPVIYIKTVGVLMEFSCAPPPRMYAIVIMCSRELIY